MCPLLAPTTVAEVKWLAASVCNSVCVCVCVCLFVRKIKQKTAETKITNLGTEIVHHESSPTN